ncbi:MAG: L,D-transpeptidase [Anaerolineaceae bacterium]|nr:L,D-transpeptidase [Anaerolineaceae bacterium]
MKRICFALLALSFLIGVQPVAQVNASDEYSSSADPSSDLPLCLPDIYPDSSADCLVLGPAQTLTNLSELGYTIPPVPIPSRKTPEELAQIPYQYAKVSEEQVPIFTAPPATRETLPSRYLDPGFKYISYLNSTENDAGLFYYTRGGAWVDGYYVARATVPVFQGVTFNDPPRVSFGWILSPAESQLYPGFEQPETGKTYNRFNTVNIYSCQELGGVEWCMIGLNEWVDSRLIARVNLNPIPPAGVTNGRWIEINLFEQTVSVYENYRLVFATLTSTGLDPYYTQPGLFQVYEKKDIETMSGAFATDRSDYYYLEDVPFTMYFDKARALHGAYWHSVFGYPRSHGCVNLSIGDSHWLYNWAVIGDWVWVHDPSGRTPTDPTYYTQGGA